MSKGHVRLTDDAGTAQPGDAHRIQIFNARTGALEIEMDAVAGGIVIAHAKDETLLGTDQFAFGESPAIVVCALKAKPVIQQMIKQDPKLGAALEHGARLAREAGIETSLN